MNGSCRIYRMPLYRRAWVRKLERWTVAVLAIALFAIPIVLGVQHSSLLQPPAVIVGSGLLNGPWHLP